jgi:predicted Zn-dependent protease
MRLGLLFFAAILSIDCLAQEPTKPGDKPFDKAVQEYRNNDWVGAERDFREVVKRDPNDIIANFYLGQTLFRQEKYRDAAKFFQNARDLQKSGKPLNKIQDRILTDQLVMSYGISGDLKRAQSLLDEAIAKDPEYPLNYFNRACAFAEAGDKSKAIANLTLAVQYKDNTLPGERVPDPRTDSSLQKYAQDPSVIRLAKTLGYQ